MEGEFNAKQCLFTAAAKKTLLQRHCCDISDLLAGASLCLFPYHAQMAIRVRIHHNRFRHHSSQLMLVHLWCYRCDETEHLFNNNECVSWHRWEGREAFAVGVYRDSRKICRRCMIMSPGMRQEKKQERPRQPGGEPDESTTERLETKSERGEMQFYQRTRELGLMKQVKRSR